MASLMQLVQETLTPDIVGKIGGLVGETPATTEAALGRAVPAVLAGVLHNSSTPGGAERMRSLVTDGGWGSDLLDNLGSRLGGGGGTSSLLAAGATILGRVWRQGRQHYGSDRQRRRYGTRIRVDDPRGGNADRDERAGQADSVARARRLRPGDDAGRRADVATRRAAGGRERSAR